MAHKFSQKQIDEVLRRWKGQHAIERKVAEYDGSKWSRYQRWRLDDGTIFHISTDSLKLTITPPDVKAEAKRAARAEAKLAKAKAAEVKREIADDFKAKSLKPKTLLDKQNEKLVAAAKKAVKA
jgi:hypothetical protein